MTAERAKRLTQLGFSWATKDPRHVPWDDRYQELVVFVVSNYEYFLRGDVVHGIH